MHFSCSALLEASCCLKLNRNGFADAPKKSERAPATSEQKVASFNLKLYKKPASKFSVSFFEKNSKDIKSRKTKTMSLSFLRLAHLSCSALLEASCCLQLNRNGLNRALQKHCKSQHKRNRACKIYCKTQRKFSMRSFFVAPRNEKRNNREQGREQCM